MGVARLLAKGWIVFCVFGAAHAVVHVLRPGVIPFAAVEPIAVALFLFGAMGLLFVAGYGLSSGHLLLALQADCTCCPGLTKSCSLCFSSQVSSFKLRLITPHGAF